MALHLTLNGERRDFPTLGSGTTVAALLAELELKADRVAVERNGGIVSRSAWQLTVLADQDRIEIVHFVGGGKCP